MKKQLLFILFFILLSIVKNDIEDFDYLQFLAQKKTKCDCKNDGICESSVCYCKFPFTGSNCDKKVKNLVYLESKYYILIILAAFLVGFIISYFLVKYQQSKKKRDIEIFEEFYNEKEVWKVNNNYF